MNVTQSFLPLKERCLTFLTILLCGALTNEGAAQVCTFIPSDGFEAVVGIPPPTPPFLRPCNSNPPVSLLQPCTPPAPMLPNFPAFVATGQYVCAIACGGLSALSNASISWSSPTQLACNFLTIPVAITIPSGPDPPATLSGTLLGRYARTWKLVAPGPPLVRGQNQQLGQVWRILVNGDLTTDGAESSPCPVPPCMQISPSGQSVAQHWVGHIDFACLSSPQPCNNDPNIPCWTVTVSLSHLPGVISHNAATNPSRVVAPAQSHPESSYHFVSPAPTSWFPSDTPPEIANVGQRIYAQSFRTEAIGGACNRREASILSNGTGGFEAALSFCSQSKSWYDMIVDPISTQFTASNAEFQSQACGSSWLGGTVSNLNGTQSGLLGTVLADWTNLPTYPFTQRLSIYWGCARSRDPCLSSQVFINHFVTGVATDDVLYPMGPVIAELFPFDLTGCYFGKVMLDLQNTAYEGWGGPFVPTLTAGITWEF